MSAASNDPPWAAYRFVVDVIPRGDEVIHLHNLSIAELLFDARNSYVTDAVGISWEGLSDSGRSLILRRLEVDFEQQVPVGVALKVGVRATTRSRRTVTFHEEMWRVDPPVTIAVARSVHVVVNTDAPGAVELPEEIVERFEAYEGRALTGTPGREWPDSVP